MKLPIPPAGAQHAAFYQEVVEVLRQVIAPTGPQPVWGIDSASDLPTASDFSECAVYVRSIDVLAISNGTNWIRQDDGTAL